MWSQQRVGNELSQSPHFVASSGGSSSEFQPGRRELSSPQEGRQTHRCVALESWGCVWEITEVQRTWDPVRWRCTNLGCVSKSETGVLYPRLEYLAHSEPAGGPVRGVFPALPKSYLSRVEKPWSEQCPVPSSLSTSTMEVGIGTCRLSAGMLI